MKATGPGTLRFVRGISKQGFLQYIGDLWRENGDVFRVRLGGRTMMFVMHPDVFQHVTVAQTRTKYDKAASHDPVRKYLTGQGLVGSTGELWRRQRKLLAPFFTPKGIRTYADVMVRDGLLLRDRWQEFAQCGVELEMSEEMSSVTASIILRTMFGSEMEGTIAELKQAIETMVEFPSARLFILPLWMPTKRNRKYVAARELAHGVVSTLIAKRRSMSADKWPDDLLTRLMLARDEESGEAMSESLLRDESLTAFFAGHETTARTLTFLWYALATHPDVRAKLHAEIDRVLGDRVPTFDDLKQLSYTLQLVKEVLRLYPAAPFYARDAVQPDQIKGYDVPEGTIVMLSPYYSHRHPEFWREPERFDPDRWTREGEERSPAYNPFGAGPRVCIGNSFSLLETHLLVAILAQRFTPQLRPGYQPKFMMKGVLGIEGGLPMTIVSRDSRAYQKQAPGFGG